MRRNPFRQPPLGRGKVRMGPLAVPLAVHLLSSTPSFCEFLPDRNDLAGQSVSVERADWFSLARLDRCTLDFHLARDTSFLRQQITREFLTPICREMQAALLRRVGNDSKDTHAFQPTLG